MRKGRLLSFLLTATLVVSSISTGLLSSSAVEKNSVSTVYAATANDYGLMDNIQDGVILHCFDWKYNDIKAELPNIAKAGFTSVQTSPAQVGVNSGIWYWLYQPLGFYVGTNDLGTREELRQLCEEADKYGIKIIVDVVANHLAGNHTNIQSDLKDEKYWHTYGKINNYSDRVAVTTGDLGMQDIKSEDLYVQQQVRNYILDLKSLGVDGIRWDAAKHIALPSEGCGFWSYVCENTGLYHYGEILGNPGASSASANNTLMAEYTTYMSCTDSAYGQTMREAFNSGTAPTSYGNWTTKGISAKKLVYWGESHDNWSNDKESGYSNEMSQNVIDRAYAMTASRQSASALYFSRPSSAEKTKIKAGVKGSTHFQSAEVAAINHFHNAMSGQSEYFVSSNNVAAVCREKGVVIAMGSGSGYVSIPNGGSKVAPGTYKDEITGNTFTVTSSTISGTVGSTGIAVVYDYEKEAPTTRTYTAYIDLPSDWSTPIYCYVYDEANGNNNGAWPGVQMTLDTKTGYYKYQIPSNITTPRVIFYSSDTNRYPGDQQAGLAMTSANMLYKNGSFTAFNPNEVTTTQKPTTQTTTTQKTNDGPLEVIGEQFTSPDYNKINIVWGQDQERIDTKQVYNVYLDGNKVLSNVVCASYDLDNISAGTHTVKVTAVLNGKETTGVTGDVTVQERVTEKPTEEVTTVKTIDGGIEINGYQVNAENQGIRTVYSVDSKINDKDVVSSGLIYSLEGLSDDNSMYVGSNDKYVAMFESTKEKGQLSAVLSDSDIASSYAMTMQFVNQSALEWTDTWKVRAYAKLSDGSFVYSNIKKFTIYSVADELYRTKKMTSKEAHDYLYDVILSKTNRDYLQINYGR